MREPTGSVRDANAIQRSSAEKRGSASVDPALLSNRVLSGEPSLTRAMLLDSVSSISILLPSRDQSIAGPQPWQTGVVAPPRTGISKRWYFPAISSANDSREPSGLIRGHSAPPRSVGIG